MLPLSKSNESTQEDVNMRDDNLVNNNQNGFSTQLHYQNSCSNSFSQFPRKRSLCDQGVYVDMTKKAKMSEPSNGLYNLCFFLFQNISGVGNIYKKVFPFFKFFSAYRIFRL